MKKKILTSLIIVSISLSSSIPAFAQDYKSDRHPLPSVHKIYTFGNFNKGVGPVSLKLNGWKKIEDKTFYFDKYGNPVKSLVKINGKLYYFNNLGEMQTGLIYPNIPCRGYEIYYFDKDTGVAVTNKWEILNGKKYYFNSRGLGYSKQVARIDGKLYAFNGDGSLNTTTNGLVALHSIVPGINPQEYYMYFLKKGVVQTGWHKGYFMMDNEKYDAYDIQYFSPDNGAMVYGWQKIEGKTYYFRTCDGTMLRGIKTIDGKVYDFGYDGVLRGEVSK